MKDTKPASGAKEDDEEKPNERETAGGSGGDGKDMGAIGSRKPGPASHDKDVDSAPTRKPGPAGHDKDDSARTRKPGPVRIVNAPATLIAAKEVGDFVALGGYIESIDGGGFVLRDTWHG